MTSNSNGVFNKAAYQCPVQKQHWYVYRYFIIYVHTGIKYQYSTDPDMHVSLPLFPTGDPSNNNPKLLHPEVTPHG